jgi:hypothetical protein
MFCVADSVKLAEEMTGISEGVLHVSEGRVCALNSPSSLKEDLIMPLPIAISFLLRDCRIV